MAGKCISPDCECLDYCEAIDPFGKPQHKTIRCYPGSEEHLKYEKAFLNNECTDKGFVSGLRITSADDTQYVDITFKPHVF